MLTKRCLVVEELARFEKQKKIGVPGAPQGGLPANAPEELKKIQAATQPDEEQAKMMSDLKQRLVPVPPRYQTLAQTPLTYTISTGSQEINITLEIQ